MRDDNILYALCTDTCSNVTDDRKTEILDSISDVPTISSHDVIHVFLLVAMVQVHTRKKAVNWIALMIKQVWYKTDKNPAANLSFEPQV